MDEVFFAGFGESDITPEGRKVELEGQYYRRVAEGVHSRLKASALYLERGGSGAVMVSLDVLGVPEEFCGRMQAKIAETLTGLRGVRVVLNATHTHNAPGLVVKEGWRKPGPGAITPEEFGVIAEEKIIEAVKTAAGNRKPAGIACATGYACAGHPRRALYSDGRAEMYGDVSSGDFTGMEGGQDPGVEFMFFFDENEKPFGAVVNAACPSQVMEARRVISSDYMGALREKLKSEYGNDFKTVCQVSAAGCQSPRDLARKSLSPAYFWAEEGVEILSSRLFDAAVECLGRARKNIDFSPPLVYQSAETCLPVRRVSYGGFRAARKEKKRLEKIMDKHSAYLDFCAEAERNEKTPGRVPPYDSKLHHFVRLCEQEAMIERYEKQFEHPHAGIDLCCLRLGPALFCTNPFELFLEYGRAIRARSRAENTFVIQLANGSLGYLPTEEAERHGGYGALVMNGRVGSEGGRKLVDDTLGMSETLFPNNLKAGK